MCKNDDLPLNEKWLVGATYDSRQLSIKNLLTNIKSAISNLKNGNIKHFKINFRSKKARNQFFFLDSRELRDDGVLWPRHFNKPLKMRKGCFVLFFLVEKTKLSAVNLADKPRIFHSR
ncbi:hypothetical protein EON71_01275 [bacterium]|nr:MAG: hypothetical protein EON71_01275 [bacterium]